MKVPKLQPRTSNCEVLVHGNGFLAHVDTFAITSTDRYLIPHQSLVPGDTIRLEITPEYGGRLTVQLGVVRWINGDWLGIHVILMETDAQRRIDEMAWSYARGEPALVRWLRKTLRGDRLSSIQLSFEPVCQGERVSIARAA